MHALVLVLLLAAPEVAATAAPESVPMRTLAAPACTAKAGPGPALRNQEIPVFESSRAFKTAYGCAIAGVDFKTERVAAVPYSCAYPSTSGSASSPSDLPAE
jgi:hypothetical protein